MKQFIRRVVGRFLRPIVHRAFFEDLVRKTTNFGSTKWLGVPIWQNIFDLWTIQETIAEVRPELLIETGTNRGGSSRFYAHLFDLMQHGSVITVDVEQLHQLTHPRITYLLGSSTATEVLEAIRARVAQCQGPIMVILDSDHAEKHVREELRTYTGFVTPGSYCLVQDGVMDVLPIFASGQPGPLPAIEAFLAETTDFTLDEERTNRFYLTHHPKGWLRRKGILSPELNPAPGELPIL